MDLDRVERVLRLFERSHAQELQVHAEDWRITIQRGRGPSDGVAAAPGFDGESPEALVAPQDNRVRITAPRVGIFRRGERRLTVGDRIEAGTAIGAIESMKILSPVFAESPGRIEEILVEDGHPVEYGEPLFVLRPSEEPEEREAEE